MHRTFGLRAKGPFIALAAMLAVTGAGLAHAAPSPRIKDIVDVQNVRPNQLVGYGLVVGLQGTGDRIRNVPFTEETLQAMLERMGVNIRGTQMLTQNVAAVSVTATMPPFARAGSTIDVQVSAMGDATSLQGGTLLVSSLRALDGEIYAVAQGPVAVSGFKAQGAAARLSRGVATSARIAGGGIIEREVPYALKSATSLKLALKNPDFTTAARIAATINRQIAGTAEVLDPATVEITPTASYAGSVIELLTRVENLTVEVDLPARVVINEAAGTVVMGADVRVSPVAIAQGGLTISVTESPVASQPGPFSNGTTAELPRTRIEADDGSGRSLAMLTGGTSLQTLVSGLNALGVSPRDLITILQALKTAGALQAEIAVQ
jgi:flagellar P-ring protein precursor FlgI